MLTLDGLAGVKQVLLFITQDAPVALQALTAVGEGVDGQAGAMHASAEEERRNDDALAERRRMEDDGRNMKETV